MAIPNLSNSLYVARLRHIQSIHESSERRNPDTLVRHFMPLMVRLRTKWLGSAELSELRADPFYYYLVARTKYYDQVVKDAVSAGVKRILSVGSGGDTRAYRFQDLLRDNGVNVLECDQVESITAKERLAKRWRHLGHVQYLPLDLNDGRWPELESWLGNSKGPKMLVLTEGVSPYVNDTAFCQFLSLLKDRLAPGSEIAYDFKISGVSDDFGCTGQTKRPFRLSPEREDVETFHASLGLHMDAMELSSELSGRLLPGLDRSISVPFREDGLVRLHVCGA